MGNSPLRAATRKGHALWWLVDGAPVGETVGSAPFAWEPTPGKPVISCATADGVTASVRVRVTEP